MHLFARLPQSLLRLEQRLWLRMEILSEPHKMTVQRSRLQGAFYPANGRGNMQLVCAEHNSDPLYAPGVTDGIADIVSLSESTIMERANRRDDNPLLPATASVW